MTTDNMTIELSEGSAASMGDGVYVVMQNDERGVGQSVGLRVADLENLLNHARERGEPVGALRAY